MLAVHTRGLKELRISMQKKDPKIVFKRAKHVWAELGRVLVESMKSRTDKHRNTGRFLSSMHYKLHPIHKNVQTIMEAGAWARNAPKGGTDRKAGFKEGGRPPGKPPPRRTMANFLARRYGDVDGHDLQVRAYSLQMRIKNEGVEPIAAIWAKPMRAKQLYSEDDNRITIMVEHFATIFAEWVAGQDMVE